MTYTVKGAYFYCDKVTKQVTTPGFFLPKNKQPEARPSKVGKMLTCGPIVALLIKHNVCTLVGELGG